MRTKELFIIGIIGLYLLLWQASSTLDKGAATKLYAQR